jgi:hypothetical protein
MSPILFVVRGRPKKFLGSNPSILVGSSQAFFSSKGSGKSDRQEEEEPSKERCEEKRQATGVLPSRKSQRAFLRSEEAGTEVGED